MNSIGEVLINHIKISSMNIKENKKLTKKIKLKNFKEKNDNKEDQRRKYDHKKHQLNEYHKK